MRVSSLAALIPATLTGLVVATSCNFFFPFNADQACESEIRALCHFAYSCCNASERDTFAGGLGVGGFRNEGECVNELLEDGSAECGNALEVQDAISQGRFEYDGALAQKCLQPQLDALNQCAADKVFNAANEVDDECVGLGFIGQNFAFGTGKVKEGDGCFQSFECADEGSVCDIIEDEDPNDDEELVTAAGECRSPAKEGEDCSADGSDGLCEPGTFCGADETCQAVDLKDNGEACFFDGECISDFCDDVNGGIGGAQCADKLQKGDECFDDNDCQTDFCKDDQGTLTCEDPPTLVVNACNGIQGDDTDFK